MSTHKNNGCPKGYIMRRGYTRKFRPNVKTSGFTVRRKGTMYTVRPKANTIRVPPSCIKNRGLPGKGAINSEGIGKLRKGELIKYGYQYRLSDSLRQLALKRAIKHYGPLSVYRKLDAVAKLSIRTAPDATKIFARDRNWVKSNFELKSK
jgi:ribosomal protein L28